MKSARLHDGVAMDVAAAEMAFECSYIPLPRSRETAANDPWSRPETRESPRMKISSSPRRHLTTVADLVDISARNVVARRDGITVAFHLDNDFNASLKYLYYGRLLSHWFQARSTIVKRPCGGPCSLAAPRAPGFAIAQRESCCATAATRHFGILANFPKNDYSRPSARAATAVS
ncbi:hypothetical protein HDG34_007638 [Paraburkholderia sp. HC6.4b]|uniref:hypothetical protein n=1 Tax=unclassified Paraburkholderia TaxID=2615204 RepID=UPI00162232B8|nr:MULTISPECIES: hypothetical protein [unclassified Paraburkholderia]MBB5413660.1 hypothetical protein [Paraburkholderia sp. HC6.4b]MBB5455980.1 hypothetical protein [Paraburkholderia sp. Kb1A]